MYTYLMMKLYIYILKKIIIKNSSIQVSLDSIHYIRIKFCHSHSNDTTLSERASLFVG